MHENRLIYLDNAATTFPKPEAVYQAADAFYREFGGNAGRGANPLARRSADLINETRTRLAAWLEAPVPERVILTSSATLALNQVLLGARLRAGDAVYVTPFEHNAVLRPLEHLRQSVGIEIHEIPFDRQTFACLLDQLEVSFRMVPPALVCLTQASNVCGIMPPILQIAQLAKIANPHTIVVVDGAQTAGLYPLPLGDGFIDALIFSGHKALYGPYGVAGFVLTSSWRPEPILFGGTGTSSERVVMPEGSPTAYEPGSYNIWAIAGLNAALQWLHATGREAIVNHVSQLSQMLCIALTALSEVTLYKPPQERSSCGIVSFTVEGISTQTLEAVLGARGIAVRAGLHCAPWAHRWLGTLETGGTVRCSCSYMNESSELQTVLGHLRVILQNV